MNSTITRLLLIALLFVAAACNDSPSDSELSQSKASVTASEQFSLALKILEERRVFEPQLSYLNNGSLVLFWRERGDAESNIFAAIRSADGVFGAAVRVNDAIDTVASYAHDGMRAAIAVGSEDTLAVAWADSRAQLRVAVSNDGGQTFEPSIRLDQADAPAYRGYPAIAFDASDVIHAVWIDSRFAEDFAEEPADLFYAELSNGEVAEKNLTEDQVSSICGCCRPFIDSADNSVNIVFRNTTDDGYRDPYTFTKSSDGTWSAALPVGNPLWKLNGCPMAGPILRSRDILWHDGSTGRKLAMTSSMDEREAKRMFTDSELADWIGRRPPRAVATTEQTESVLLLPGEPHARLATKIDSEWRTIADDLPDWATSAAYDDGQLLLVGARGDQIFYESRMVSDNLRSHF